MDNRIKLSIALMLACVLHKAQSEITTLTGTAGQNVTLETGITELDYNYILWSRGSEKHVLINYSDGKFVRQESPRFHLNTDTGSLTIGCLSVNDSGLYEGQIINTKQWTYDFNLTVVEAEATTPNSELSERMTADQRSHETVVGPFCLVLACIFTIYIIKTCAARQEN